jgi:hypothetical protein
MPSGCQPLAAAVVLPPIAIEQYLFCRVPLAIA